MTGEGFQGSICLRVEAGVQPWYERTIRNWAESGVVAGVELIVGSREPFTPCGFCQSMGGRRWKLGEQPELPFAECTNKKGCRCAYLPILDTEWRRDMEQLKRIEDAIRGTSVSNRKEWTVLVPILIVMVLAAWIVFAFLFK